MVPALLTKDFALSLSRASNTITSNTSGGLTLQAFELIPSLFRNPNFTPAFLTEDFALSLSTTVNTLASNTRADAQQHSFDLVRSLFSNPAFDRSFLTERFGLSLATTVNTIVSKNSSEALESAFRAYSKLLENQNVAPATLLPTIQKIIDDTKDGYAPESLRLLATLSEKKDADGNRPMGARITEFAAPVSKAVNTIASNSSVDTASGAFSALNTFLQRSNPRTALLMDEFLKDLAFFSYDMNVSDKFLRLAGSPGRADRNLLVLGFDVFSEDFNSLFNSKVMGNKKLLRSRSETKTTYIFLCNCVENYAFGKEAQRLLLEANVGADQIVKMAKLLSTCKDLDMELSDLSTAGASQPTAKLREELMARISEKFEAAFGIPLPAEKFDSVAPLLVPLITYKTFVSSSEVPNARKLNEIFTDSVHAWMMGGFSDYKFPPAFKEEIGEAAYLLWAQERKSTLASQGTTEDVAAVQGRVLKALLEVREHFFDSVYLKEGSQLRDAIVASAEGASLEATVKEWCIQSKIKDVEKFASATAKAIDAWKKLGELIAQSEKESPAIAELQTSISEFAVLARPVFSALRVEGAKPQLDVLVGSTSAKPLGAGSYVYAESGSFPELFSCGKVEGMSPCQAYDYPGVYRQGLTGYVELPWIKIVTTRRKGSEPPEQSLARAMIKLTKNPSTKALQIIVESLYGDSNFSNQMIDELKAVYEPAGIAVIPTEKRTGKDIEFLKSGRSPVSYSDAFGGNQDYRGTIH